ncbi:SCY1-like protein 2 [Entomortierella parvispora]|uniref:SCY1-like protein 2 n=1 Tax=Entomortierella parvispora TaxID=205924 RepID=A0A9P3LSV5_9FUNG|nr:SCY1-like protein 2 [Entomortierella parvispora]
MGNAITKNYEVGGQIASAGLWKIHRGTKRTTGQEVAVFIFEKNIVDSISSLRRQAPSKRDQERVYEFLKKEASQLARLRHPCMLEVVEPVDESRTAIAFATEPIFASLSNLLGNYENLPQVSEDIRKFELDELEIQKGLLQLGKGLQFCHNDAKIVHGNLVPDAIFVNAKGDWKIAGFGFSTFLSRDPSVPTPVEYWDYDHDLHPYCQRDLNYQAPEYVLDQKLDPSNDMFGIGCLAYSVLNKGSTLFHSRGNLSTYRGLVDRISAHQFDKLPAHLADAMTRLITREPSMRMNAIEFQSSKFFDNILVSTMRYMENFAEKTRDDKGQFMKGLLRVLPQFPERVLYRKILPCLLDELKDHALLPYTLPNVFYIIQKMTPKEFEEKVLPSLKPIFLVREPMQNLLTLLEKIELLQQKAGGAVFKEDVMPLVYCALEPKNPFSVQEKALKTVPMITEALDYTTVKTSLFPRIATLFSQTTTLSVKVNTLLCFLTIMKILDKYTITEKLIPLLRNIKTREVSVTMATLQVYQEMGKYVEKEVIGNNILPHLWHLALGPNLKVNQFESFMSTIQELSTKVHQQHLRQLQDLKKLEDQTKSFANNGDPSATANGTTTSLNDFEKLVHGGSGNATPGTTGRQSTSSTSDNPFKIASDNPFSPSGSSSQDSSLDMFGDMASSLPPLGASKPMTFASTPVMKPATPSMFGAISADSPYNSRPMTPTNSSFQQSTNSNGFGGSQRNSGSITTPTGTPSSFSIPPLNKPMSTGGSTNSNSSSTSRPPFSQPQQKPAGTPPLSHTLGNMSSSNSAFGGFQSAAPTSMGMTASMNHQPMASGGMGGGFQQQQNGNQGLGMGMGMGMGMNTLTPARPANTGMGMMSPMQPLQPMGGSQVGGVKQQNKGKNSDLGMFDPFS